MAEIKLSERVNLRAVKFLNSMPKEWWKKILKTDASRKFEVEYSKVKAFLHGQLDGSGIAREYKFADGKTFGRLFDHSGLQGMQKAVRGVLCEGEIVDLDIVNCHPMILAWICQTHDISCPNLEYYIVHRDKILNELQILNFDREDAKKLFLKSTNSCWRNKDVGYDFFKQYDTEMKKIQKQLMSVSFYDFIKPKIKKGDNEEGSFINLCLCYHENLILMKAKEFLESKEIEICTLAFDGLMYYGKVMFDLLDELNLLINKEFNFPFKFVYKPHSTDIKVSKAFEEKSVNTFSYKAYCEQFNKTVCKVGGMYMCENIVGKKVIHTEMELKARFKHIRVFDKPEQFIDLYVKNTQDTNMRVYSEFGLFPVSCECPSDVYNLWEPFAFSRFTGEYTPDTESFEKIMHLISCLANHEENVIKFLLDWMAQMVQYPQYKSVVPVIISEQGAGKNTLMNILKKLLGDDKVWECTDPLRDIFGHFNDQMQGKFLINLSEAGSRDFCNVMGKVKAMVTDETFTLHGKNKPGVDLQSFHRFCLMTNHEMPIPTFKGDRRFGIIRASDELIDDNEFFNDMNTNVMQSEAALRTFWDFLKSREVKKILGKDDLPQTEYHEELKQLNMHPILQWLEDLAMKTKGDTLVMYSDKTWDSYRCFCLDSNINVDKTNRRGFEVQLTIKKIPGVSKKQSTHGRARVFDLAQLRDHFKITSVEETVDVDDPE